MLYYPTGGGGLNVDELSDLKGTRSSQRYEVIGSGVPRNSAEWPPEDRRELPPPHRI